MRSKPLGAPADKRPVAAMARGTSRMPKDNLALDAMDARAAGMTYGKYKAQHPETRPANEARLAAMRKKPAQKPASKVYEFTCRLCGEKFTTTNKNRRYCGDDCKAKKDHADYRAKHGKKEMEE